MSEGLQPVDTTPSVATVESRYRGLRPFRPGPDPRRGKGNQKAAALRRRLKKFDEDAWSTLQRLFSSDDPDLQLEALKFWGKYRLDCLLKPAVANEAPRPVALSPETAARLAALDG